MKLKITLLLLCVSFFGMQSYAATIRLDQLDVSRGTCGDNKTIQANKAANNNPLTMKGVVYQYGIGTHAESRLDISLRGESTRFKCVVGIDDSATGADVLPNHGISEYRIINHSNGKDEIVKSGTISKLDAAVVEIDLDVTGWEYISLVSVAGNGNIWADLVNWCNGEFEFTVTAPMAVSYDEMLAADLASGESVRLDQLKIEKAQNGWGTIKRNLSIDGNSLTVCGKTYTNGVGTHAPGRIDIKVNGATRLTGVVGIDDEVGNQGNVGIKIINRTNGQEIEVKTGDIRGGDNVPISFDIDVTGWDFVSLVCTNGSDGVNSFDHVDWCDVVLQFANGEVPVVYSYEEMMAEDISFTCLTNHYSLPNTRMMHRIRASKPDAIITVSNLPEGLQFNVERNLVEGKISTEGTYTYNVTATSGEKSFTQAFTVNVSSKLISPTPLMGWMSWNIFQGNINETNIKQTADLMVSTGLKDAGFSHVLIDDHWHAANRAADNKPLANTSKFPSGFNSLTDYIHNLGLKVGIYSDAATRTCGGEFGSLNYEMIDAQQYADWGFDFLKYDYCGAPSDVETAKKRYKAMSDALKATGKDFFFNICEWGERKPWLWAAEAGGHAWRTTFDSRDIWGHGRYDNGHNGVIQTIDLMKGMEWYAGPNQFNDADMVCAGLYGTGKPSSMNNATGMTDTEYEAQFSMWVMFNSPLLISFDLSTIDKLSAATKRILTNKEVIAINQDPMGQAATCIYSEGGKEVYMKDLENGDVAVAFLNRNSAVTSMQIGLDKLFLSGSHVVRDLWLGTDAMTRNSTITATVRAHQVKLFRVKKSTTSVETIQKTTGIKLNKSGETLYVKLEGFTGNEKQAEIIDISGKIISKTDFNGETTTISISNLTNGIYFLKINSTNQTDTVKFQK